MVIDAHFCEYTKNHWIVYLKFMNCTEYEFYINII